MKLLNEIDWPKGQGLLPAVIQDADTLQFLMVGFMNQESLQVTLDTNRICFFSRTKNRRWTKGETSGNFLNLLDWKIDCDNDSFIFKVRPTNAVCHLGTHTCFGEDSLEPPKGSNFLFQLEKIIFERQNSTDLKKSYVKQLFESGADRIIQKFGEESVEVLIASKNTDQAALKEEVADLFFHLLMLLQLKKISLQEVFEILEKRNQP